MDLDQTVSGSDHLVNRIRIRVLSTQGSVKTCGLRNRSLLFLSMAMELLESPKQGCGSRWRPPGSDFREKTDPRYFRTPDTDPTFIWNLVRFNLFYAGSVSDLFFKPGSGSPKLAGRNRIRNTRFLFRMSSIRKHSLLCMT